MGNIRLKYICLKIDPLENTVYTPKLMGKCLTVLEMVSNDKGFIFAPLILIVRFLVAGGPMPGFMEIYIVATRKKNAKNIRAVSPGQNRNHYEEAGVSGKQ